jgi:hypothetical protein
VITETRWIVQTQHAFVTRVRRCDAEQRSQVNQIAIVQNWFEALKRFVPISGRLTAMPFPEAVTFREPVPQHDSRNGKNNPAKDDVNASWIGHDFLRLARKSV